MPRKKTLKITRPTCFVCGLWAGDGIDWDAKDLCLRCSRQEPYRTWRIYPIYKKKVIRHGDPQP